MAIGRRKQLHCTALPLDVVRSLQFDSHRALHHQGDPQSYEHMDTSFLEEVARARIFFLRVLLHLNVVYGARVIILCGQSCEASAAVEMIGVQRRNECCV